MASRDDLTHVDFGISVPKQRSGASVAHLADLHLKPHRTVLLKNRCLRLVWRLDHHWQATAEASSCRMVFFVAGEGYRSPASALALAVQLLHKSTKISAILTCALLTPPRHLRGHRAAIIRPPCSYFDAASSPPTAVSAREFLGSRNTSGLTTVRWASGTWA